MTSRWHQLRRFFGIEYNRLVGYVRGLIHDSADLDAEDIVQEVAFRIFEKGNIGEPIEHIGAYVYQALRNRVVDSFRRKRPDRSLDEPVDEGEGLRLADVVSDAARDPRAGVERSDLFRRAISCIRELPERDRAILIATEIEGLTFAELSEWWDVPLGTLLSQKSRAVRKVRFALESLA